MVWQLHDNRCDRDTDLESGEAEQEEVEHDMERLVGKDAPKAISELLLKYAPRPRAFHAAPILMCPTVPLIY
jgi:hypothetical protein